MNLILKEKYENLKTYLKNSASAVVAFSSGVDSTFLLSVAADVLKDKVLAVSVDSCSFPKRELKEAVEFCTSKKIKHIIIKTNELEIEGFRQNPKNRCYLCKKEMFLKIKKIAKENGIKNVLEGSNIDDEGDYRPGLVALGELDIKSPLREIGFTKEEIRTLSKYLNLKSATKPAFACLSSRIPYGDEISKEKLNMIDKAEQLLLDLGFYQVRVRMHDKLARIEILDDEFEKLLLNREKIVSEFEKYGFYYVSMDLKGYRTGSLNEVLDIKK